MAIGKGKEPETSARLEVDADSYRRDYLQEIHEFRETYRRECFQSGIDYVPLDTSMPKSLRAEVEKLDKRTPAREARERQERAALLVKDASVCWVMRPTVIATSASTMAMARPDTT